MIGSNHSSDHDKECGHNLDNTLVDQGHSDDTVVDVQWDTEVAAAIMVVSSSG